LKAQERDRGGLRRANSILKRDSFLRGGTRPLTEEPVDYIDEHSDRFGVEAISEVLPIAPSAY
jgi:hypothetical protein